MESHGIFTTLSVTFVTKKLVRKMTTPVIFTKNKHPELYAEVCKSKSKPKCLTDQPSLSEVFQKAQLLSTSSCEHTELTRAVTYSLAKKMLPISTVEMTGFKATYYIFTLDISYQVTVTLIGLQWLMKLNVK